MNNIMYLFNSFLCEKVHVNKVAHASGSYRSTACLWISKGAFPEQLRIGSEPLVGTVRD